VLRSPCCCLFFNIYLPKLTKDVSKQYYMSARNLESISQADLNKCISKQWTTFNKSLIFGAWKFRMIQIGKHQDSPVQLFLKAIYASVSLGWRFV
jgi:hypothetical protein